MNWTHIILHHSLTGDGQTVSWQDIRRYHVQTLGWLDIGYHFGVELINGEYEALVGRNLNQEGAHTLGMNDMAIGICVVGNFDDMAVPVAQWEKAIKLVKSYCEILSIPYENIRGHRDFADKTCPGRLFDMNEFRTAIAR